VRCGASAGRGAGGSVTTISLDTQWEETTSGAQRVNYSFNGEVVGSSDGSGWYTLHGDHLGSMVWQFNASGAQVGRQESHPWGVVSASTGTLLSEAFNYTGQRRDEIGLLYYHARSDDPAIGRFIVRIRWCRGRPMGAWPVWRSRR
jgi:hypothetical protein